MIDTKEMERILEFIESIPDENVSVKLLKEFSEKHKNFSKVLFDKNSQLTHEEWKQKCTGAKLEIDEFIGRLESMSC